MLVPVTPDDPAVRANQLAWDELRQWFKPTLLLWAPNDPVLGNQRQVFLDGIPGTAGLSHQTFEDASHFVQEDVGPELARATINLVGPA
jgi:haloalkane dehalogenase